jgi:hypothetical protein
MKYSRLWEIFVGQFRHSGPDLPIPTKSPVCNGIMPSLDSGIMPPPCNGMIRPGHRCQLAVDFVSLLPRADLQRFIGVFSALRNLFVPSRPSTRPALAIHLHRLWAIAEWRSVTQPA